jgi:hypothetical protein
MNKIQRARVTCYMEDIQLLRGFGEGQANLGGYGTIGRTRAEGRDLSW